MKVTLIEILQEARKYYAEIPRKYSNLTPEQYEAMDKLMNDTTPRDEEEEPDEQDKTERRGYHPAGRGWVIYCMTNKLCADGFTPAEADILAAVAVKPEETSQADQERADELRKRGPLKK